MSRAMVCNSVYESWIPFYVSSPANMFLRKKTELYVSKEAVMLTIEPQEISGVKVEKSQFTSFRPFGWEALYSYST